MITPEQLRAHLETYNIGHIDNNSVRMGIAMSLTIMREADALHLPLSKAIKAVQLLHDRSIEDPVTR